MSNSILVLAALLPAVVLCVYIFIKDRVEKEPLGLLFKLLIFGALSCFPAAYIESAMDVVINGFFPMQSHMIDMGTPDFSDTAFYGYNFVKYFIGIALVEEGVKLVVMLLLTRKNKEHNSLFDGIIYAVFASLGFAALENVLYVLQYGFSTAIMRAVLSVPGHMFYGVLMGYHYSVWHITNKAISTEKALKARGLISAGAKEYSSTKSMIMCILIPTLAHGYYDFCCMMGTEWAIVSLLVFVVFLYVHCFRKVAKMSRADRLEHEYVNYLIKSKYPNIQL